MTWFMLRADPDYYRGGHSEPLEFWALIALCLVVWYVIMRPLLTDNPQPE
ncbi:hypothetical protein HY630_03730 [Candidatus Uhrbacteria bacterium]|nr:hypothetical protein [Candidatus Uhrbacteria bacterium]